MKDIPVPVEALNDVLPGSPWQPEHAARYNALNALLRQEEFPCSADPAPSRSGETLLPVRNITDEVLPGNKAVEICPDPRPGQGVDFRNPMLFGRAVAEGCRLWGIAMEDIAPGHGGLVQIGGLAVVGMVQGTPDRFIVPKPDGRYYFSNSGRAEVLYRTSDSDPVAVVCLGGGGGSGFNGMFRVTENFDNTVTVDGGMAIVRFSAGPQSVEGTTLQRPVSPSGKQFVMLNATLQGESWILSFSIEPAVDNGYVAGSRICWPIARLTTLNNPFAQLWQGGMIDFGSRYYVS